MQTILFLCLVLLPSPAPADPGARRDDGPAPSAGGLHAPFDALLAAHVRAGVVDYRGLLAQRQVLDDYRAALAGAPLARLSREETLAFWINAYNAFTLELIIEHEVLRKLGEPRIHFAIVCASKSCPDLRSEAYVAERLEEQLADATARFLSDERKGLATSTSSGFFGGEEHEVRLSRIFDWFEQDFEAGDGSVLGFVRDHAPAAAATFLREHSADLDLEWLDYDWTLNDAPLR
jgi:hypothetical protein